MLIAHLDISRISPKRKGLTAAPKPCDTHHILRNKVSGDYIHDLRLGSTPLKAPWHSQRDAHDILRGHAALDHALFCECRFQSPTPTTMYSRRALDFAAARVAVVVAVLLGASQSGATSGAAHGLLSRPRHVFFYLGDPIGCCLFCRLQSTAATSYAAAVHAGAAVVPLPILVVIVTMAGCMTR